MREYLKLAGRPVREGSKIYPESEHICMLWPMFSCTICSHFFGLKSCIDRAVFEQHKGAAGAGRWFYRCVSGVGPQAPRKKVVCVGGGGSKTLGENVKSLGSTGSPFFITVCCLGAVLMYVYMYGIGVLLLHFAS